MVAVVEDDRENKMQQLRASHLAEVAKSALLKGRYVVVDCFEGNFTSLVTTRIGGQSESPFDSFNMAYHVGDNPARVAENRKRLREDFGFQHVCYMDQTHSNEVMVVDESNVAQEVFQCDGLVTKLKGVALAVMTADCLPLMLCDEEEEIVGAIHCGWRGIASGIIANAIDKMESIGARRNRIIAYMGPAIGPRSFEVGDEVRDIFVKQYQPYAEAFVNRLVVNPMLPPVASAIASSAFSLQGVTKVLEGRLHRTTSSDNSANNMNLSLDPHLDQSLEQGLDQYPEQHATAAERLQAMANQAATTTPTTTSTQDSASAAAASSAEEVSDAEHKPHEPNHGLEMSKHVDPSTRLEAPGTVVGGLNLEIDDKLEAENAAYRAAQEQARLESKEATAEDIDGTLLGAPALHVKARTEVLYDPDLGEIKFLKIEGKHLCNIYELAVLTLQRAGATGYVYGGRFDTFTQSPLFYSYRREHRTGRMASVISVNP